MQNIIIPIISSWFDLFLRADSVFVFVFFFSLFSLLFSCFNTIYDDDDEVLTCSSVCLGCARLLLSLCVQ